jgi:putative transposase
LQAHPAELCPQILYWSDRDLPGFENLAGLIYKYPHHITQCGNNRAIVFFDDEDRQTYLKPLAGYAEKHHFQVSAYCLMNNHIHLLVVPEAETSLARGIGLAKQLYTQ